MVNSELPLEPVLNIRVTQDGGVWTLVIKILKNVNKILNISGADVFEPEKLLLSTHVRPSLASRLRTTHFVRLIF
jgi:hypothetical protein